MIRGVTPIAPRELRTNDNPMQSTTWAFLKSARGMQPMAFRVETSCGVLHLLLLLSRIPSGKYTAYCPWGPEIAIPEDLHGLFLEELSERIKPMLPSNTVVVRYDLPWESPYETPQDEPSVQSMELRMNIGTEQWRLRKASTDIQPPHSVVIHTTRDLDTLLDSMKSKTRYNIRLAYRRGVEVKVGGEDKLGNFFRLYEKTMERKGLRVHPESYFRDLLTASRHPAATDTDVLVLSAELGATAVAAIVVAVTEHYAMYLYGASDYANRHAMGPYALQWRAIEEAHHRSCLYYDLFGVPKDANPSHPMSGLLRFKAGFGGEFVNRLGCWDFPFDEQAYQALRGAQLAESGYYV